MKSPIYISDYSFVAPVDQFFKDNTHCFSKNASGDWISKISNKKEQQVQDFLDQSTSYKHLDRSVQLALFAASTLKNVPQQTAVNIGSSRGATGLWETYHEQYIERVREGKNVLSVHASPLTTLGNISSWVAQSLQLKGAAFSHSITCATASHAILNAIAWIGSDMASDFIAGGSEAPLTGFTIEQMKALRIYSKEEDAFPCRALDVRKSNNSMILGEAAALFQLTKKKRNAVAKIVGYGTAIEQLTSATSLSDHGDCLQRSMHAAIKDVPLESIDAIITHAPGTLKGDQAELNAINTVFKHQIPYLCNTKWQIGHSLGASAAMNLVLGLQMLERASYPEIPYLKNQKTPHNAPQRVLINATGFGGNAVSLLIDKID